VRECAGHVEEEDLIEAVTGCPCSAEATPGTLSWRAAMVRAVTYATQRPFRAELETLMTRVSEGSDGGDLAELLPKLTVRRYVRCTPGMPPALTDFGWAYLKARAGGRRVTDVTVRSVDVEAQTAEVIIPAFSADQPVTVPLDQILNSRTGLTVETAGTVTLYAEVNTDALRAEHVVLTRVHNPAAETAERAGGGR